MPQSKKRESSDFFKQRTSQLAKIGQLKWCCSSICQKFMEISCNPLVSKVRQFLLAMASYRIFTLARGKFKLMKASARFKNEIWLMDLANIDKLAKDDNGVKHLLVRRDLCDGIVEPKGKMPKVSKETFRAYLTKKIEKKIGSIRLHKNLKNWRRTKLLYKEWDKSGNCWTYKTIAASFLIL